MKVLVATKDLAVFDALQGIDGLEYGEALFTGQIYEALPGARLIIVDFDDLVEHPYSVGMLRGILSDSDVPFVSSEEFLSEPDAWLMEARRLGGEATALPTKRTIAFVSYSGGVGKTVIAMDTAAHFARRSELPVCLLEFTYGESAFGALIGSEVPALFELATQPDVDPFVWNGVTLVPMDYDNSRDLSIQLLGKYLKDVMREHVLTVIDAHWPHALIGAVRDEIDRWYVVCTPRPDAVDNAEKLAAELGAKAAILLNQKGGMVDSLAMQGVERAVELAVEKDADRWSGKLGKKVLLHTYGQGTWGQYEPTGFLTNLRRRFSRSKD
ncbi:MAG: hypothetical protein H6648_04840 [Caldilineae bacterium]|nr:hypothetical protein [Chloroflexota bacterium]MCB9176467.1 hypothetical protein [Caldilineae bacterium]